MPLLLRESEVRHLLPMNQLIDVMATALADFSAGTVAQPVRNVLEMGPDKNYFGTMPAYLPSAAAAGAKLVTVCEGNLAKGMTSHLATILLLDPETGALRALLDGRYITEARTAAVSAVSARYLAREDASKLAIIGSGVQARSHLEALSHVRKLTEVRAYSPNRANLDAFCADVGARACSSAKEAVDEADLIVVVTSSREPVVRSEWVADGSHIMAVGACRPTHQELTGELAARSSLYVDSRAAALKEAGDILLPISQGLFGPEHILAELGELPKRKSASEVTLFKSLGMAVEDVAAASLVYNKAVAAGIGVPFTL
jgi:alanine dehydrogenase